MILTATKHMSRYISIGEQKKGIDSHLIDWVIKIKYFKLRSQKFIFKLKLKIVLNKMVITVHSLSAV